MILSLHLGTKLNIKKSPGMIFILGCVLGNIQFIIKKRFTINEINKEEELKKACENVLKLLNGGYYNPHVTVIITPTSVELLESVNCIENIYDYLND